MRGHWLLNHNGLARADGATGEDVATDLLKKLLYIFWQLMFSRYYFIIVSDLQRFREDREVLVPLPHWERAGEFVGVQLLIGFLVRISVDGFGRSEL